MNRDRLKHVLSDQFLEKLRLVEENCNTILVNKGELQLFVKWCHNIAGREYVPEYDRLAQTKESHK